jgi:hypothetical protein
MTSGLGVDPTKSGTTITSGTTSQDIQQIFGGLYTPGMVSGGTVTTSPSAMTYTTTAGVAIVPMATGQNVPIPVPATTITALAVPASGTRTDIIYAQQRTPAIDGDSDVIVNYGPTLPARSVALKTYTQPAGATNSSAGAVSGDIIYSIPYGASLGQLHFYNWTTPGALPTAGITRVGAGTIFLPTDRLVNWKVVCVMYAMNATGFDNAHYSEYGFLPHFDGPSGTGDFVLWTTPGLHQAWATYTFEATIPMAAGTYNVNLGMLRIVGPGTPATHYGGDSQGFGRRGIEFTITDVGVLV